jgi:hypothetical protein
MNDLTLRLYSQGESTVLAPVRAEGENALMPDASDWRRLDGHT